MKKSCSSTPGNRAKIRTIKAGSVHLKIYTGTLKKRPIFTAYWRVGEKPFRKLFVARLGDQSVQGAFHCPAAKTRMIRPLRYSAGISVGSMSQRTPLHP